jgi:phosphopentomutase
VFDRITVIVLDGVGVGATPDAAGYGDEDSTSNGNTARVLSGIDLLIMRRLGLGDSIDIEGVPPVPEPQGGYGKMQPISAEKDTISGRWEIMGIYLPHPSLTYPQVFPEKIIESFEKRIGRKTLANYPSSGAEIIQELGEENMRTGKSIVYTSTDSVFQIAAHEEIISIEELFRISQIAREVLKGESAVGRVIARPFVGNDANDIIWTENQRDFSREPETDTVMDKMVQTDLDVWSVGKIVDIFVHRGISRKNHSLGNLGSLQTTVALLDEPFHGLMVVNLIGFSMIFGHRNNPQGYYQALKTFDDAIPGIQFRLADDDSVIVLADHGVDPTTEITEHSREYVTLLVFGSLVSGVNLGTRSRFTEIGVTITVNFGLAPPEIGISFLNEMTQLTR